MTVMMTKTYRYKMASGFEQTALGKKLCNMFRSIDLLAQTDQLYLESNMGIFGIFNKNSAEKSL